MRVVSAVLSLALLPAISAETAIAQGGLCRQLRAELASLGSPRRAAPLIQRQQAEVARLTSYYRDIGCEGGGFGFFGRPTECASISERLRASDGLRGQLDARTTSESAETDRRRQDLRAAIARSCATETRGPPESRLAQRSTGARRLVCVRTCDGFFFPLSVEPGGGNTSAELCQASCPNAETMVFRAPPDGDIEQAVSERGKPYTQLANASRYQKVHDPHCSCKAKNQTWAQVLRGAEAMLPSHKGDITVTAAKSAELARPPSREAGTTRRGKEATVAESGDSIDPGSTGSVHRRKGRRR